MMDLSDSIKQGYLLLEDPIDKVEPVVAIGVKVSSSCVYQEWNRHYFVLTPHSLYFTHAQEQTQEETEIEEVEEGSPREMHYNEKYIVTLLGCGYMTSLCCNMQMVPRKVGWRTSNCREVAKGILWS